MQKVMPYIKLAGSVLVVLIVYKLVLKLASKFIPASVAGYLPQV